METQEKIKGKRGRPSGTANTTAIEDELIEPFKIYYDETQFTLVKKKPDGIEETYGYYRSLSSALQKIAKNKLSNNNIYSLKLFISEYKQMLKEFTESINFEL